MTYINPAPTFLRISYVSALECVWRRKEKIIPFGSYRLPPCSSAEGTNLSHRWERVDTIRANWKQKRIEEEKKTVKITLTQGLHCFAFYLHFPSFEKLSHACDSNPSSRRWPCVTWRIHIECMGSDDINEGCVTDAATNWLLALAECGRFHD